MHYKMAFREQPKGFSTKAIHVGQEPEQWTHQSVIPPLVTSTTFKQPAPAEPIVSTRKEKMDFEEIWETFDGSVNFTMELSI